MTNAIEIHNLNKIYKSRKGDFQALKDISLKIKKGSIFGLLGPNGAGKSTLINILADTVIKTSGKISVCGYDYDTELHKVKSALGIVPQELVFDPFFPVGEALDIYAGYYGVAKKDRRTEEILTALGLIEKIKSNPRSLSGGMKRRLLIAKALIHNPEVLILDEPTAGVDVELRIQLWNYVQELNKKGTTIILTTHYLEEAEKLCDEIAFISHGEIITQNKTTELKSIFGEKKLIISLKKTSAEIKNIVKEIPEAKIKGKELTIDFKAGKVELNQVLKKICSNNIEIANITTKETALEEIFKKIVA